jgi:flagellin-specific chaperone FliS
MDKCFHKIKEFKKVVHNNHIQKTKDKLSKLTDNSQLYLYNKIKHDIVLEEYLIKEKNFKNRQLIAKYLTSVNPIISSLAIVL